jgi:hypothetical protein
MVRNVFAVLFVIYVMFVAVLTDSFEDEIVHCMEETALTSETM